MEAQGQQQLTEHLLAEVASDEAPNNRSSSNNHSDNNNNNNEEEEGEDYILLSTDDAYVLDPQRYAVLAVFSLCNLLASATWITFAPIEDAVQIKYGGISPNQVNWLSMIFMLLYGPGTAICAWSIRRFGLRETVVASAVVMTLGCILRWLSVFFIVSNNDSSNNNLAYILLLSGQGMVAIAQPVFANAPARVAAAWFQQTTQAIGIAVFAAMVGLVLGQAMSPLLVVEATGEHLDQLLCGQAIGMVFCGIATWRYFESEPAVPPSAAEAARRRRQHCNNTSNNNDDSDDGTQQQQQDDHNASAVWKDVRTLVTDKQYIIMVIAFGLGYGVNNAMMTLLQPWIAAAGFPGDNVAGLLGSLTIAGGVVGTVIAAPLLDASRNYNQAVRWSYAVSYIVAVLSVATLQPSSPVWVLAIAFTAMGMSQLPLLTICLDAAAAHSYPIPEELSSAGLQLVGQYLGIVMIDGMGTLLEDGKEAKGYRGPFNIAFLSLLGISAMVALCYNGDDPRATANHANDRTAANDAGESAAANIVESADATRSSSDNETIRDDDDERPSGTQE